MIHDTQTHHDRKQDADPPKPAPQTGVSAAEYTCPMHPEVVRKGPGSCPICGMALEPVMLSPMFATAAMSLSSVSVIGNSLRLRKLAL